MAVYGGASRGEAGRGEMNAVLYPTAPSGRSLRSILQEITGGVSPPLSESLAQNCGQDLLCSALWCRKVNHHRGTSERVVCLTAWALLLCDREANTRRLVPLSCILSAEVAALPRPNSFRLLLRTVPALPDLLLDLYPDSRDQHIDARTFVSVLERVKLLRGEWPPEQFVALVPDATALRKRAQLAKPKTHFVPLNLKEALEMEERLHHPEEVVELPVKPAVPYTDYRSMPQASPEYQQLGASHPDATRLSYLAAADGLQPLPDITGPLALTADPSTAPLLPHQQPQLQQHQQQPTAAGAAFDNAPPRRFVGAVDMPASPASSRPLLPAGVQSPPPHAVVASPLQGYQLSAIASAPPTHIVVPSSVAARDNEPAWIPQMPWFEPSDEPTSRSQLLAAKITDGEQFSFPANRDFWDNFTTQYLLCDGATDPPYSVVKSSHDAGVTLVNQVFLRRFVAGWDLANPCTVTLAAASGGRESFQACNEFWGFFHHNARPQPSPDLTVQCGGSPPVLTTKAEWRRVCQLWEEQKHLTAADMARAYDARMQQIARKRASQSSGLRRVTVDPQRRVSYGRTVSTQTLSAPVCEHCPHCTQARARAALAVHSPTQSNTTFLRTPGPGSPSAGHQPPAGSAYWAVPQQFGAQHAAKPALGSEKNVFWTTFMQEWEAAKAPGSPSWAAGSWAGDRRQHVSRPPPGFVAATRSVLDDQHVSPLRSRLVPGLRVSP
ncbi:hypothetical protein DIPPA_05452 [Diplonema papillatum]|nr:hypothetical protein DIPPA_05452 [Diplonema papillatum]